MSEEKKEEKKQIKAQTPPPPAAPVPPASAAPSQVTPPVSTPVTAEVASTPTPPKPAAAAIPPPRPAPLPPTLARTPPPLPPSAAAVKKGRRGFITLLVAVGVALTLVPYVPWGDFLSASIKGSGKPVRQKVVIDNDSTYKAAAGKLVNVNDINTFPPNSHWSITYPSSGDSTLDSQNADTFTKFDLIRLPVELGGDKKEAASFVAFSKVCVHLWCSPNYGGGSAQNPKPEHRQYECPCHGSIYSVGEPAVVNGKKISPPIGLAIEGPAAVQPPPTNAIPMLTLTADKDGTLNIEAPIWDPQHNGVLGLGRYVSGV